ncbi:MAG: putative Histidine kinase [Candidatus Nitrospira kreftii]|uniref:histidine kinase n=1 Tax=Candidatus Nitrospira kreftii TaxID=2652173 RepID=A0A7S8FFH0_9BACT|nr:MAG: putative Histidine kinase [Candidatus Nitrospira kreftii]
MTDHADNIGHVTDRDQNECEPEETSRTGQRSDATSLRQQKPTEFRQSEQSSERLLLAISRVQSLFIDEAEPDSVYDVMLQEILRLTGSEYGCIGEVSRDTDQKPYLRTYAITDPARSEDSKALLDQQSANPERTNLKALCGQVMTTGQPFIVNDPTASGFLLGHSSVHALMGLPIYRGKQLIGVIGIANRSGGYDEAGITYLEPFLSTCAQLLEGFRNRRLRAEAEDALRQSEDRFRAAVQGANEGIWDWNLTTNEAYLSPRWKAILGYEDHEVSNAYKEWESRLHPEDRDRVLSHLSDYLEGRAERYDIEFRLRRKDGGYCWINACGIVIRDIAGRPIRMAGSHTDITERKREDALQDVEKRVLELVAKGEQLKDVLAFVCRSVESLAPSMLCSVMLTDKGGTHLLSAAAPSLSDEYNREFDRIPIGPTDGSCGSAAYFAKPSLANNISTDPLWRNYAQIALAHGLRSCWSHPILSSSGTLLGTFAVYHQRPREPQTSDLKIVERVSSIAALAVEHARMMEAVKESEARFQAFMRHSPAVTFIKDTDGRYIYGNSQFETLSGMPRGDIIGKTVFDFMPTDIATRLSQIDQAVLASGQTLESEEALPTSDGTLQHWLVSKFPLDVARRELLGGMAIDISERKRVQESLLRTQFAMDQAVDAVYWIDHQARILYTNDAASAMLGYTKEEFLRMTVHDLNPDFPAEVWPGWWAEVRDKKVMSLETGHLTKEGRWIPIDIRVAFLAYGGHEFHCAFVRDISKRKEVEEAAHRSLTLLQSVLHTTPIRVFWKDRESRFLGCNQNFALDAGCADVQEIVGKTDDDLIWHKQAAIYQADDRQVMESGCAKLDFEEPGTTQDGKLIWLRTSKVPLRDERECVIGVLGVYEDITERKRVDEALRASQERFELAVRASNDGIWDWNILTGEQYWSDRHLELIGLERSAFIPTYDTWISLVHPDDAEWVHQATRHHLDTHEPYDVEIRVRIQDGSYRWFRDRGQAVWDASGRPVRMVGSISDVTERRQAEEAIWKAHAELEQRVTERTKQLATANHALEEEIVQRKRVEDRLQRTQYAFDHAADQIFVIDSNGYVIDVNESACARLGYTKGELLTLSMTDIDLDFPSTVWDEMWDKLRSDGQLFIETRHRSKSGEIYPVEVVANYLEHNGQELDYAIVRDITERKQAEEAVLESKLRYKLLTEATFDGIAVHDQGILLEVNAGLERIFGYEPGELVGRSIFDLVADESRDLVLSNMRNGVTGPYEAIGRRKDGSTFPGEIVIRPCCHRGKEVRLVAGRDITVRKQLEEEKARHLEELERQVAERTAEIAKLESQRAQTEKLAAVGQMAAAVAHEINNPIAGIRNAFILVKQAVDQAHPHYEFVGMIDREISRVATIVRNMYQLYRNEPSRVEPVHLQLLLRDLDALFAKQLLQREITFVATLSRPTMTLEVSPSDLFQVLVNLMQNAIDSSRQGGTIRLSVEEEDDIVTINVSDEGSGIAPELLPHIFDPFFTTKTEKDQKGMGLGLSVSQSLVMAMGGRIAVQTQPQRGSTFSIVLPQPIPHDRSAVQESIIKEVLSHEH